MSAAKKNEYEFSKGPSIKIINSGKKTNMTKELRGNPWIVSTIVLIILLVILLIFGDSGIKEKNEISKEEAAQMLIDFYESQGVEGLEIILVEEENELYKITLGYQGQLIPFYVTETGYLTGNAIISLHPGEYEIWDNLEDSYRGNDLENSTGNFSNESGV